MPGERSSLSPLRAPYAGVRYDLIAPTYLCDDPGTEPPTSIWRKGEALIKVPSKDGEIILLYESLDAQNYLGVSAATVNRWRREGWLIPTAEIGRGYAYMQGQLDSCIKALGRDRKDTEVTYV